MSDESEYITRQKRIDPKLKDAGWTVVAFNPSKPLASYVAHAIKEFPTKNGPADYVLVAQGKIVAVIEAKKLTVGPQGVLTQAERYGKGLVSGASNYRGFGVPFLFSTNGEIIYFHDVRQTLNLSRTVSKFFTPDALIESSERDLDAACDELKSTPITNKFLRPYQVESNLKVEEAIAERKREMLVAMATGTGKTFTIVHQCYRLLESEAAKRILFLVDRRALAAQAVRAFASFDVEPNKKFDKTYEVYSNRFQKEDFGDEDAFDPQVLPKEYLTNPQSNHVFVYVCTIQRMAIQILGRDSIFESDGDAIEDDVEQLNIPIHAFDVIIADECHRGYTSQEQSIWRAVLDHFDATRIGLTATPAKHTAAYFKNIVYQYTYEQAVKEGHLVDWDLVKIASKVRIEGVFLKEGESIDLIDRKTGQVKNVLIEDERKYDATDIEREITSPDSNRKILREIKKYTDEHEQLCGRFPKTLIFAVHDLPHVSHADSLTALAKEVFGRGDSFVRKITGKSDRPLQLIREFRNRPNPGIVVTVDLLTTGVDIPDLEFIVFLRTVQSRILFTQMLGRGTRKGFLYPNKSRFLVFDCFDGTLVNYFKNATDLTDLAPSPPSRKLSDIIEDIWKNVDKAYNINILAKRLHRIDKTLDGDDREKLAAFGVPGGDLATYAAQLETNLKKDFLGTMKLLRDKQFQDFLLLPRGSQDPFRRALESADEVSSTEIIRSGNEEYKIEDYLDIFARYVRENATEIQAMQILLKKPQAWSPQALNELKETLLKSPVMFNIEHLQRAHKKRYNKALVDIISMVKHAAQEESPLLTAEERVEQAIARVIAGKTLSTAQRDWIELIRRHLVANLSIDRDDFDFAPILEGAGGWGNANRAFDGKLEKLLTEINAAIAA